MGIIVSIDFVRHIYKKKHYRKRCSYLTVEFVDEGGPEDEVGDGDGDDEDDEGGHAGVDDGLEVAVRRLLQRLHEGAEGVLDEAELHDVELSEVGGVQQRQGRLVQVLVRDVNLKRLLQGLEVPHQN